MNGKEKIEAAFSSPGTPEIPAVICYETIFVRDHWKALVARPWWHQFLPDMDVQFELWRRIIDRVAQDWLWLPVVPPRRERENTEIQVRSEGVFRVNRWTGAEELLVELPIGGEQKPHRGSPLSYVSASRKEEINRFVPPPEDSGKIIGDGSDDLSRMLLNEYGRDLFPYRRVSSPLWRCYDLWGFETLMIMTVVDPELVAYAASRWLEYSLWDVRRAAALGAKAIWIEECFTDMISPAAFAYLNLPPLRKLIREIACNGMKSIYYYCGNPMDRLDLLLSSGADALALEEGKKGFEIDIEEVAGHVKGECVIFGNLDAVGVLQNGTDAALRNEVRRQISAGRLNRSRFIMSLGSPVTPSTPVERVRRYCDMVHEMGNFME